MTEKELRAFAEGITMLINGGSLSRERTRDMFRELLLNRQPDLQQGAFLAALTAKRETPQEIAGAWEAIYDIDTVKVTPCIEGPLVDNCGTGMDSFKTFNISTASAVVAAAGGVVMAKHGARAITSSCGAVDILEEIGVDVECDAGVVRQSIEKAGIGIFNGMSAFIHPRALYRILSQIRFGTVLNIAASLANPALPRYGVRGVHSRELVEPVARAMKEIGYFKALVFNGSTGNGGRGMDEISTLGETLIAELCPGGKIKTYSVKPGDFAIKRPSEEMLHPYVDREKEALSFLRILAGRDHGPRRDIVCLNSAAIFYLVGLSRDLAEGLARARALIDSGHVLSRLREWVNAQNRNPSAGLMKYERLLQKIYATGGRQQGERYGDVPVMS